jgi:MarR family transcriptional regulator, organic hydroperoxide resistance regulator
MKPDETAKRFIDFAVRLKRILRTNIENSENKMSEERFRTLLFLSESEGTGLKELSARICISPSSLCIMLGKLEDEGFVERSRTGHDRRNVSYRSTVEGSRALQAERERRLAFFAARFATLPEADLERLNAAMTEVDSLIGVLDRR